MFKDSNYNLNLIIDRLKSGASVTDCKQIIVRQWRLWKDNKKSAEWLRPMTLFRPENFEQYIGELVIPTENKNNIN